MPAPPSEARRNDTPLAILAWWGVFFSGPILAGVLWLTAPAGSLLRVHGRSATAVFVGVFALYVPVLVLVVGFGVADERVFYAAWAVVMVVVIGSCINGTIQARRGRSPLGRSIPGSP